MVGVAQLVERRVVASVVVGSSPITHPILNRKGCGHLTVVFFWSTAINSHNLSAYSVHSCTFVTFII